MTEPHLHQFPEEETPNGVRILFPCLLCGLAAADGIELLKAERDRLVAAVIHATETINESSRQTEDVRETVREMMRQLHAALEAGPW